VKKNAIVCGCVILYTLFPGILGASSFSSQVLSREGEAVAEELKALKSLMERMDQQLVALKAQIPRIPHIQQLGKKIDEIVESVRIHSSNIGVLGNTVTRLDDKIQRLENRESVVIQGLDLNNNLTRSNLWWNRAVFVILAAGLVAAGTFAVARRRTKPKKAKEWPSVFQSLENMNQEISQIRNSLSSDLAVLNKYKASFGKIVLNVVSLYDMIKDVVHIPEAHIVAFKRSLADAFESVGVKKWEPEVGKPVPEGCIQKPAGRDFPYPAGSVGGVLTPGYRFLGEDGYVVVKKPVVETAISHP